MDKYTLKEIIKDVVSDMMVNNKLNIDFKTINKTAKTDKILYDRIEMYKTFYNVSDLNDIVSVDDRWNVYNSLFTSNMVMESIDYQNDKSIIISDIRSLLNEYGITNLQFIPEAGSVLTPLDINDMLSIINSLIHNTNIPLNMVSELEFKIKTLLSNCKTVNTEKIEMSELQDIKNTLESLMVSDLKVISSELFYAVNNKQSKLILQQVITELLNPNVWTVNIADLICQAISIENNKDLINYFY